MPAQIKPNRMEISDRFPMAGFAIRTGEPNIDAEVVLATDVRLFRPENRAQRTAANFYSSREHGTLTVPRGEGVFIVPPEVLARFIGNDRLFFGLATGRGGSQNLTVDALPRDGSPYISLRGFTGRTLRRGFRSDHNARPPLLEWAGDEPRPGTEPASPEPGNPAAKISGPAAPSTLPATPYDDGFGPMPQIPAREASHYRGRNGTTLFGRQMSNGLTADEVLSYLQDILTRAVNLIAEDVSRPFVHRLSDEDSATFITIWQAYFEATSLFSAPSNFYKRLPDLAERTQLTLSAGPGVDTPFTSAGVGVLFSPDRQVAFFAQGEFSVSLEGVADFFDSLKASLTAKVKFGFNEGGISGFENNIKKVASRQVGAEIVGGAEAWLDANGAVVGGAVAIGVGFALQFSVENEPASVPPGLPQQERQRAERIGGMFSPRLGEALDRGLDPRLLKPLLDVLDAPLTAAPLGYRPKQINGGTARRPVPPPRTRAMDGGAGAAIAIGGFIVESIRDSNGDITWELDQFRAIKHPNDQAPANPAPFRDAPTINLNDWPVWEGVDDISAWFKIDWQYNGRSLGNVRIVNTGTNDAVGFSLHVRAQIMDDNRVYQPANCAALRLTFHYRFSRVMGTEGIAIRNVTLYGDGQHETSGEWLQSSAFAHQTARGNNQIAYA